MTDIYAVVYEESTHHEGDERSRTHPGHGYPAHTTTSQVFKEFKNRQAFEQWATNEMSLVFGRKTFRAFRCTPIQVTSNITFDFKEEAS